MKTFKDLRRKVQATSKEELEQIVLAIAKVWLNGYQPAEDAPLNPDTPLDSESLERVTVILSEHGLWPDDGLPPAQDEPNIDWATRAAMNRLGSVKEATEDGFKRSFR